MAKYFFDLMNGNGFVEDIEGCDLPNRDAMLEEIASIFRDIVHDELKGNAPLTAEVTVRNDKSEVVTSATLSFQIH